MPESGQPGVTRAPESGQPSVTRAPESGQPGVTRAHKRRQKRVSTLSSTLYGILQKYEKKISLCDAMRATSRLQWQRNI